MKIRERLVSPVHTEADFRSRVYQCLLQERPFFHGDTGNRNFSLPEKALSYLFNTVQPGWRTLEIGMGYSTLMFALQNADHTVIAPADGEYSRIKEWANSHGLSCDNVRFTQGFSEQVLPALETEPLDLVLIDGWHAFPSPFINWYYSASLLKVGGLMVLDDTQLRTYSILKDFLLAETGRWEVAAELTNLIGASDAIAFRKLDPDIHRHFGQQPWMSRPVGRRRYISLLFDFRHRFLSQFRNLRRPRKSAPR